MGENNNSSTNVNSSQKQTNTANTRSTRSTRNSRRSNQLNNRQRAARLRKRTANKTRNENGHYERTRNTDNISAQHHPEQNRQQINYNAVQNNNTNIENEETNNNDNVDNAQSKMNNMLNEAQQAANVAKKFATGNKVGAAVDAAKMMLKKKNIRKIIIHVALQLAIPFLIILLVVSVVLGVLNAAVEAVQGVINAIINFFTPGDDGAIVIEDEQADEIIASIEELGISAEDLKLLGDKTENATEEQQKAELRKYIKKFMQAQAVTETLNYNHKSSTNNKTYGAVYVYRSNGDSDLSNDIELTYKPYSELSALINGNNSTALNYFSYLETTGELVYAGERNTKEYEGSNEFLTSIAPTSDVSQIQEYRYDYKSAIAPYKTKMNFLIYLTVISQNPEFVSAVVDLIKDSRIELTIMDTTTTRTETVTTTYTEHTKTLVPNLGYVMQNDKKVQNIQRTVVTDTVPTPKITYVKTWFCEQEINYSNSDTLTAETPIVETLDDEAETPSSGTWKTDQKIVTEVETNINAFAPGISSGVDVNIGQRGDAERFANGTISEPTFVGLMETEFKIPYSTRYEEAGSNIKSGAEMLFFFLQKDPELENMEILMRYALYIYSGKSYGVTNIDGNIFDLTNISGSTVGNISAFGTTVSREEFIRLATEYGNVLNSSNYNTYMIPYLGDFYDIATSKNVNPILTFAHACLETNYGSSSACRNNKNYFGYAHGNDSDSGKAYSTPQESIEDYCNWVVNNATPGTSAYSSNLTRGQELAEGNSLLNGTPDTNVYVLYCRYAQLGEIHYCDEPDFSNPAGTDYYLSHGSDWGRGGRVYIYEMYEKGALYTGEYATRCGHPNASDPTTVTERADYAVYSCNQRVEIAKDIFGSAAISTGESNTNVGGIEVETYTSSSGKTYIQYKQDVGPWANMSYGDNTISYQGCSITSVAIILSGFGYDLTPANWSTTGYYSVTNQIKERLSNTTLTEISPVTVEVQSSAKANIQNHLKTGNPVVIHVLGSGKGYSSTYTQNQHYMALLDISDDGTQVYVSNPYSTGPNGWEDINVVIRSLEAYILVSP